MTTPREQRITDLHDAMAIQIAILAELGKQLRVEGLDDDARILGRIVFVLEHGAPQSAVEDDADRMDPVQRVKVVVPLLKSMEGRMGDARRWRSLRMAVESVRKVLVRYADFTLTDTQPIDLDALGLKPRDEPKDGEG